MVQRSEICSEIISLSNNIGGDGFDNIDELIQEDKDVNIDEDEGKGQVGYCVFQFESNLL